MICITGSEATVEALAARLAEHDDHDVLHEVRLDALAPFDEAVYRLCANPKVLVTCRPEREGGAFAGGEQERLEILRRAAAAGAGYLDVELSTEPIARRPLQQAPGGPQIVLSWHGKTAQDTIPWHAFANEKADVIKVALPVDDSAELAALLPSRKDVRETIRIGMGDAGLLSRALYQRFASPWTYVAAREDLSTAAGQLTFAQARAWRITERHTPLGVIGGSQITSSPGPRVYNALFSAMGWPFVYLPVLTTKPRAVISLLERLEFAGVSVTMPAKELLLSSAHQLDQRASDVGALNTLVLGKEHREGLNTDVLAIEKLLARRRGQAALVLGTGGAARAALGALKNLGSPATICGRNEDRARALARRFRCAFIPWDERVDFEATIVINTTPCGVKDAGCPLPEHTRWQGRVLVDAPITAGETAFAHHARLAGAQVIDGKAWWLEQGLAQMEALLRRPIPRPVLQELLHG